MAAAGPPCVKCGWTLRWFPPRFAWVCDRCRRVYPSGPPAGAAHAAAAPVYAPAPVPAGPPPTGVAAIRARAHGPNSGLAAHAPAPGGTVRTGWRPSRKVLVGGWLAAIAVGGVVIALQLSGGDGEGGSGAVARSRDELVRRAVGALATHDAAALIALSDYDGLRDRMLSCDDPAQAAKLGADNRDHLERSLREEIDRTRDAVIALVDADPDGTGDDDVGTNVLTKGDSAGDGCTFKTDARFHDVKFKVSVTTGGATTTQDGSLLAIELAGVWHLLGPPRITGELGALDCESSVNAAMNVSRADLLKVPGMTASKLARLTDVIADRCITDVWPDSVRRCLGTAAYKTAVDACLDELPANQVTLIAEAILRAADEP